LKCLLVYQNTSDPWLFASAALEKDRGKWWNWKGVPRELVREIVLALRYFNIPLPLILM
jgi:hypothetical protein